MSIIMPLYKHGKPNNQAEVVNFDYYQNPVNKS